MPTELFTIKPLMESKFRLELPQEPVDGWELEYFDIDGDYLSHIRLKFHVNTKWSEIEKEGRGLDLINQWQVFDGARFVGRIDGWARPLETPHANSFNRRDDAVTALVKRFTERAIGYEKMAQDYHERAQRLRQELGHPVPVEGNHAD